MGEAQRAKTALEQIAERLDRAIKAHHRKTLLLKVGDAAASAIICQTDEKRLPAEIMGVRVERTGEFRGWEIYQNGQALE